MEDRFRTRVWDIEREMYIYDAQFEPDYDFLVNDKKYIPEQCTGIRDYLDMLIYEGDIVRYHVLKKVSILIEKEVLVFKTKKVTFKKGYFSPVFNLDLNDVEIIGNIHENPELLEE